MDIFVFNRRLFGDVISNVLHSSYGMYLDVAWNVIEIAIFTQFVFNLLKQKRFDFHN